MKLPSDWADHLGEDFAGKVLFKRSFNRPTGLEPDQHVDLFVEKVNSTGEVVLNGQPMGVATSSNSLRVAVMQWLQPTNKLSILVEMPTGDEGMPDRASSVGGILGEVRLEIHDDP